MTVAAWVAVYVNGFEKHDGSLKVVSGSHFFRDHGGCRFFDGPNTHTNNAIEREWCAGKIHPITGKPLEVEVLSVPRGSVVIMHTHAAHGVSPRAEGSGTRYCVVTAYRNPVRWPKQFRVDKKATHTPCTRSQLGL